MAASNYLDQIQKLYVAYFGRPADPEGLNFWAEQVDREGGSLGSVISGFSDSTESQALYGNMTTPQVIQAIYANLFSREPDSDGLAFWQQQIDSGAVPQAQAALAIMNIAAGTDAVAVGNKLTIANAFTAQIDTPAEIAGYSGANSASIARAYLAKVDATDMSMSTANATLGSNVIAATGTGGSTPPPSVVPTPTFVATLDPVTHEVSFSGTATGDITVSWSGAVGDSVATFSRGGIVASPVSFGGAGASSVVLASTETLTGNAAKLIGLLVNGTGSVKLSDTAANLSGKAFVAPTGTHDILTVTDTPSVATTLAGLSGFETVNLSGSTAQITVANGAGTTVNNTGSIGVVLKLGSGGQTFNGGAGTYTVTDGSNNDTFNLGAGNYTLYGAGGIDTFNIGAGSTASLGGLSGSDTAVVSEGGTFNVSPSHFTASANAVNNGTFTFTNAVNVNLSLATGSNGFTVTGSSSVNTLVGSTKSDMISAGTNNNTLTGGDGNDTFNVAASASGKSSTITDLSTGDILVVGSTGVVTANNISAFVATGATVNSASSNTDVTLNAAATGATIDLHLATGSTGFSIVGGAGANTIIGSSNADKISGGASADTLTGGGGADNYVFAVNKPSTIGSIDTITDYRAAGADNNGAADTITTASNGQTVASNINTVQDLSAQASLENALNVVANAATTNNGLSVFLWGGDSYIYIETVGAVTTYAGSDTVIKLTGTPFVAGSSIIGLGIDGV